MTRNTESFIPDTGDVSAVAESHGLNDSRGNYTLEEVRSLRTQSPGINDNFSITGDDSNLKREVDDSMSRTDFYDLPNGRRLVIENPDPKSPDSTLNVGIVDADDTAVVPDGAAGGGDGKGNWSRSYGFKDGSMVTFQSGRDEFEYRDPSGNTSKMKLKRPIE